MGRQNGSIAAWRDYWEILEETRMPVEAAVMSRVMEIPAFMAILEALDPERRAESDARSLRLKRGALLDDEWEPYLDDLRVQGATYAAMGVVIDDWYSLMLAFRPVVRKALMRRHRNDETRLEAVLSVMDLATDRAMQAITSGYVEAYALLQRSAEEERELYVEIVQNAPVGIQILRCEDRDDPGSFEMVAVNPAALQGSDRSPADQVGKTLRQISPALLETPVPGRYADSMRTGEARSWEITYGDEEHPERTYAARCFPLDGKHLGVMFEDISARRKAQVLLERSLAELERSNVELDRFAYIASHDLKSPLRDVDNLAMWITEDAGDTLREESRRDLTMLRQRVQRMERLLDDLLDYSRAGRLLEPLSRFDLVDALQVAVEQSGVPDSFDVQVHCGPVQLTTPRAPLELVVRNLVTNACKHHDRDTGSIRIEATPLGDHVQICVEDDGPGIPPEHHERCFQMFKTLRPRDEVEGTGIGLSLVQKIVASYGQGMELHSDGRGCSFRFDWPVAWTQESAV